MWQDVNIATKELLPILLAVAMWGVFWRGNQILVQCDNMAIVQIIAANTSTDPIIMHLLKGLHFFSAYYNINLRAVHIPGSINVSADAISRNLLQVFFRENPRARRYPTPVPECFMGHPSENPTRLEIRELERIAGHLIKDSIADSTRRSYCTGQSAYLSFCSRFNLNPLPASEQQLILFTADMSQRLAFATIRAYLSAVRFLHISNGHGDPLAGKLQLDLLLRGVRRNKPGNKDKRLPVTPLILEKMYGILDRDPGKYENKLLWAACCIGFFGFLRSGEFTSSSSQYDPLWHLSIHDISVDSITNPAVLQVTIKGSKTDQLRQGVNIIVGRTRSQICPMKSVLAYIACRGFKPGPLFCHRDGSPLTREQLVSNLRVASYPGPIPSFSMFHADIEKLGIGPGYEVNLRATLATAGVQHQNFSGHSFRIGAATTAAARGVADSTIQTLGRWKSDSFKHYIRMQKSELASISDKLIA